MLEADYALRRTAKLYEKETKKLSETHSDSVDRDVKHLLTEVNQYLGAEQAASRVRAELEAKFRQDSYLMERVEMVIQRFLENRI